MSAFAVPSAYWCRFDSDQFLTTTPPLRNVHEDAPPVLVDICPVSGANQPKDILFARNGTKGG